MYMSKKRYLDDGLTEHQLVCMCLHANCGNAASF